MSRIGSTEIIVPKSLTEQEKQRFVDALYRVHCEVFDGVERESFAKYVVLSKADHTWIQVHKNEAGEIVGYFAVHVFERELRGEPSAVFRAEAGTLRAYRGGNSNARFGITQALRYMAKNPGRRLYYLGSLVHPSSYSLFTKYFDVVWPTARETPPDIVEFMSKLASEFGLEEVEPGRPLVRKVGWRTRDSEVERNYWRYHCDKPSVRYFLEANPGYGEGHGLVTLVPVTLGALAFFARRMVSERLQRWKEALVSLVQRLPIGSSLLRPATVRRRLKASPLFANFDDESLAAVTATAQPITIPAGTHVFRQGDASDDLYLVARGALYVLSESQGEEKILDEVGAGALLGEIAMLSGERRSASIRAATPTTLVRIGRDALFPLLEMDSSLREALWSAFAARRFDDCVRELERFRHLGRMERQQWIERGQRQDLAAKQEITVGPETAFLFVFTGAVELEQGGSLIVTRAPTLIEVKGGLRVTAQVSSRIVRVPHRERPLQVVAPVAVAVSA
jgi:hypothetical protein